MKTHHTFYDIQFVCMYVCKHLFIYFKPREIFMQMLLLPSSLPLTSPRLDLLALPPSLCCLTITLAVLYAVLLLLLLLCVLLLTATAA